MTFEVLTAFMTDEVVAYLAMLLPLLSVLLGLTFAVTSDAYIGRRHKRVLLVIVLLLLMLIWQNYAENLLAAADTYQPARVYVSILGYSIRPMILVLFCHLVEMDRSYWAAWAMIAANILVHLTALWSHVVFFFNAENHYEGGPLMHFCLYISLALMAYLGFIAVRRFRASQRSTLKLVGFNVFMILASLLLDSNVVETQQPVTFLTIAMVCSSLFFYIWLHLQFVREHERELIDGQNMQLMLSQIQPHFLINSLEVIRNLCRKNPSAAEGAVLRFEKYLRGNMDSLTQEGFIPLSQELDHTRQYLELEQLRFPDELHVVWDIRADDFRLPTLTVQPLVENAVRHGIRGSASGSGTVTVATREREDRYEVIVTDDGPGFDPHAPFGDDRTPVGLQNVRQRLEKMGGALAIDSSPEIGRAHV